MKLVSLLIIDLIFAIQLVLFMNWFYPKTISCCISSFMLEGTLIGIIELFALYVVILYNVIIAFSE